MKFYFNICAFSTVLVIFGVTNALAQTAEQPTGSAVQPGSTQYHRLAAGRILEAPNLGSLYPYNAMRNDIPGKVVLHCVLKPDYHLHDCVIVQETPPDQGFGKATLELAKSLRVQPSVSNGQPLDDELIEFPMTWQTRSY